VTLNEYEYYWYMQVWLVPLADKRGWQVKLLDPSLTCAIPECLRDEQLIMKCCKNKAHLYLFTCARIVQMHAVVIVVVRDVASTSDVVPLTSSVSIHMACCSACMFFINSSWVLIISSSIRSDSYYYYR